MGMGHSGAYADVIDEKVVKEASKETAKALKAFKAILKKHNATMEEWAMHIQYDPDGPMEEGGSDLDLPTTQKIAEKFGDLIGAFQTATGLTLYLEHHDSESCGDRYDEVDGAFWCLGEHELYCLTRAGAAMKGKFQRKHFVVHG